MCGVCTPPALSRRTFLGLTAGSAASVVLTRPETAVAAVVEPAPGLRIHDRSAWGSTRPPTGPLAAEEDVRFLLVHHTASDTLHDAADVPRLLRRYFDLHTGSSRGWADIAYNFLVDRDGGVWEGRAGSLAGPVRGDATGGNQGYDQLVCVIGDFTSVLPTPAAQASLTRVLAWLADRHRISTASGATTTFTSRGSSRWPAGTVVTVPTISGHRQLSETACPGAAFFPVVRDELTARVQAQRTPPPLPPTTTPPPPRVTSTTAGPVAATAPTTASAPPPMLGTTTTAPSSVAAPRLMPPAPRRHPPLAAIPAAGALVVAATATAALALRRRRSAPPDADPTVATKR